MIESLLKIEFVPTVGDAIVLLDYGDDGDGDPKFALAQAGMSYTPVGAPWSRGVATGGAEVKASWTRKVSHPTHQAAESYRHTHPAEMPLRVPGKLRVSIQDGDVIEYIHARVEACVVNRLTACRPGEVPTLTEYRCTLGKPTVVTPGEFTPPVLEPGDPPALVESGELEPGEPPSVMGHVPPDPPDPLPLLGGITISGITSPLAANGNVPKTGLSSGYLVFNDADVTVQRISGQWRIQGSGGKGFNGGDAFYPWLVAVWTPYGGATGTPSVSPLWAG